MSRRAFVTGAGGFIASHLTEVLLARGWQVRALVHYNSNSSWGWLDHLRAQPPANLEVCLGDVRDPYQMLDLVRGCDTIFNLAALIGIPYSYEAPASYVETNLGGTLHLLEAARRQGVACFVQTSTSEVYGSACRVPMDEGHPLQAQSPYAATKIAADKLAESYWASYELPVVVVRPFNTFGPRQSARAIIPTIIRQAMSSDVVQLGAVDPLRDLTYVDDTVAGFLAAAEHASAASWGHCFNLGTGDAIAIGELASRILALMDRPCRIVCDAQRARPSRSEVRHLQSDHQRATGAFGWEPRVSLDEGLRRTIAWCRADGSLALDVHAYAR